ncbi:MAG TPA: SxtJ family membrane protein, partial [Methylomirabilota bacterium]|nr:SxtJ family membrane protein [Methylomirabilota bacterium]
GPGMLRKVWAGWKRIAFAIGLVQSRILLTALYVVVVAPFALGVRLLLDPLRTRRRDAASYYLAAEPRPGGLEEARRQY